MKIYFQSKTLAEQWGNYLCKRHKLGVRYCINESDKGNVLIIEFPHPQLEGLAHALFDFSTEPGQDMADYKRSQPQTKSTYFVEADLEIVFKGSRSECWAEFYILAKTAKVCAIKDQNGAFLATATHGRVQILSTELKEK